MIKKSKLDNNNTYFIDVIVRWAISAKNALQSCYGFSPNQLIFGKSADLVLVKHLNALHAARKAFIKAESNKLRCALKAKNWETTGIEYKIGDMLYYKR